MIHKDSWELSAWSIIAWQMENRKPERDGARRGRRIFQQKISVTDSSIARHKYKKAFFKGRPFYDDSIKEYFC
jgi:hypothetical protein